MRRATREELCRLARGGAALPLCLCVAIPGPAARAQPEAPPPAPADAEPPAPMPDDAILVADNMTVDLHLQDEDLANVLQMLSIQSQRNIVASKGVNARVTANLYGVTFYEALDAVLHVNGYGYVERGNFIYVYTIDELSQIRDAERRPIARVITLNYLNAVDAAQFVQPLLTEDGEIRTNGDVDAYTISDVPTGAESFALSSTLVVYDYPDNVDEVERLLRQLDTRPAQVLVEATILQTTLNEANAFGVDFSVIGSLDFADFLGGPLSAFNALQGGAGSGTPGQSLDGQAIVSTPGNTSGPGTFKIGVVDDNFSVFVRLLDSVTDTTVLSSPKILALNRQPARVLVGERLGYLSTTSTETATTQSVEFLDTGTQLAFRPFISNDGMIRMELRPSVSAGSIRPFVDVSGRTVTIPDERTQEITTNVIVRDGSTIVLGGLFTESTTLNRNQVPILGDIPIIGLPFRGHDDSTVRNEIIFLITPTIVNDGRLIEDGERGLAYAERLRAGARQGLLPWSRDRMTARLNMEAEDLARQGKTEDALWKLQRSLELNPAQPDAIRLRETLSAQRASWPSRSLLEQILGRDVEERAPMIAPPLEPASMGPDIPEHLYADAPEAHDD